MAENEDRQAAEDAGAIMPYLHVAFQDDHSIDGMKVEIRGATPVQIAAAIWYLTRAANQLQDAMDYRARMNAQNVEDRAAMERIQVARSITDIRHARRRN